jgi:hypothetical protein
VGQRNFGENPLPDGDRMCFNFHLIKWQTLEQAQTGQQEKITRKMPLRIESGRQIHSKIPTIGITP